MANLKMISFVAVLAIAGTNIFSSSGAFAAAVNQSSSSGGKTVTKAPRCFTMCTPGPVTVPCKAGQAGRFIKCTAVRCTRICVPAI